MADQIINHVVTLDKGHYISKEGIMKMYPFSRILVLIATLLLPVALFTAIWKIHLWAPQYPEGLEMQIWADKLTGDVTIINGLNHYIGMANIEESMFPELTFLRYIIYGMIAIGMITFISNRKWLMNLFTFILIAVAIAAMVDMYLWGYKYGHNLDPHAAIKIEGESYQPPLIGYKQLLNFLALSMPAAGGFALFGSGLLAVIAWLYQRFRDRKVKSSLVNQLSILLFSFLLPSCQPGADKINFGVDDCDHCGMKLVDNRFGCQFITDKGKTYKFDDVNCLSSYVNEKNSEASIKDILVIDFSQPGNLVNVNQAVFIKGEMIKSPMGSNVAAFAVKDSAARIAEFMNAETRSWQQVQNSE